MSGSQPLIDAMRRAVADGPDDPELRLHLSELLLANDLREEAIGHLSVLLALRPGDSHVQSLMRSALDAPTPTVPPIPAAAFDWHSAESEVADIVGPAFVVEDEELAQAPADLLLAERPTLRLSDVGGMSEVKKRLESSFLTPLRNPELRKLYGKSLRGGLLLYGPPGCGKTYIARAIAGELDAKFLSISIADVLHPLFGQSERNVHDLFQYARREAPCVIFIDEVDSLGLRRNTGTSDLYRGVVNQLLTELDGVAGNNDGVFVLAATNQPWDVDPAFRRPGRLDRTVLVLPPDELARAEIFRHHLEDRPVEGIELRTLAKASDGLSGADIAYVCELASERALMASVTSGEPRMIGMLDLTSALAEVPASTGGWLDSARNFIAYGKEDAAFDDLRRYLKTTKRL